MTSSQGPVHGTARSVAPVVLAVLGTLAGLVVIYVASSSEWISLRVNLDTLLFLPVVLGTVVEVLLRRRGTPAARAAAWTLFGGVVCAMVPLVLYALFALFFTYPDAEPEGRDGGFVALITAMAVLSLAYALALGIGLTGHGQRRVVQFTRLALLAVISALRVWFLVLV